MAADRPHELMTIRALVSYLQMASFFATLAAVVWIITTKTEVTPLMAGILGTILGATSQAFSAVRSYWLPGGGEKPPGAPGTSSVTATIDATAETPKDPAP